MTDRLIFNGFRHVDFLIVDNSVAAKSSDWSVMARQIYS
jgi:hypothetical protein